MDYVSIHGRVFLAYKFPEGSKLEFVVLVACLYVFGFDCVVIVLPLIAIKNNSLPRICH